jgi:predicted nucleotidyltransferase
MTSVAVSTVEELARAVSAEVAKRQQIAAAWIFGSAARGEADADSDLDLAVLLRPEATTEALDWLYDLAASLEPVSPSGHVDIVLLGRQGSVFRHRILSEGVLVHDADPDARIAFEGRTICEYLDWKPTHDIAMRVTFAGLRDRFARGVR